MLGLGAGVAIIGALAGALVGFISGMFGIGGGFLIVPGLAGLTERHPRLQVDIHADDRLVDMAREGIDMAIRTGTIQTDAVIARELLEHGIPVHDAAAIAVQKQENGTVTMLTVSWVAQHCR